MENFDPKQPSKGLGDSIAKITHALGIDKVAESVAHLLGEEDCGCDERREKLNKIFPYKEIPEEQYLFIEPRMFEVLNRITIKTDGNTEVSYQPGEKVLIEPGHPLYLSVRRFLEKEIIKQL